MTTLELIALDLVAIVFLTFGLYFPRHRRRSLVAAFLTVNVAVVAVTVALAETAIDMGVGLGLFGILSIIRLRSSELDQHEVAYYFASLALGLLAGLGAGMGWITPLLMAAILGTLYVGDHPSLLPRYRRRNLVLNAAFTDERELVPYLEKRLGAKVHRVRVKKVDFVNETTSVEVRLELPKEEPTTSDVMTQLEAELGTE
jgi:hypothetical protein